MPEPELVEKAAFRVVGREAVFVHVLAAGANSAEVVGPLWEGFLHAARKVPGRVGEAMYGVISDEEGLGPGEMLYLAGVAVSEGAPLPAGMVSRTVPAGTYAVFEHRGPIRGIRETVAAIYREWLPGSGYRHANAPDMELYDRRFHPERGDSVMEYWVPVVRSEE